MMQNSNPVVIIDPIRSGSLLAPAFLAKGVPSIALCSAKLEKIYEEIKTTDFQGIYDNHPEIAEVLASFHPRAIIAGSETGVELADQLASVLTPNFANIAQLSLARRHKGEMQAQLAKAGLPHIRTICTADPSAVRAWLKDQNLIDKDLIIKPPLSMGSDKVFHIAPGDDWESAFQHVLSTRTAFAGVRSDTVIVQEKISGIEYSVDTVSANGQHALAHLTRYQRTPVTEGLSVMDHTEFMPLDDQHKALFEYSCKALDALGIRWGASHNEVMLTEKGPVLIELGARMSGGPVLALAKTATGSNQLELMVEAYLNGTISTTSYTLQKTVVPVFLNAKNSGRVSNAEILDPLRSLPTCIDSQFCLKNGDLVSKTIDVYSTLGMIALAGERSAVFEDYQVIREVESQLILR